MLQNYYQKNTIEAGCDEAGRGCLAGPVYAAAVILPTGFYCPDLNDSKKLSEKKREQLRSYIEKHALAYAVASCTAQEIDNINILNASYLAMHRAITMLSTKPELILVDGNRFNPYQNIAHQCIVKGDAKFASIAAASILAKTHRDQYMKQIHTQYPNYNWQQNKGYPTRAHRTAVKDYGFSPFHRKSFKIK